MSRMNVRRRQQSILQATFSTFSRESFLHSQLICLALVLLGALFFATRFIYDQFNYFWYTKQGKGLVIYI